MGIIPFVVNALTVNVNPIKLREYLAAGLPVVSTRLPEIEPYGEVVHLASSESEFIEGIEKALQETGPDWVARRQKAVAGETWQARVEEISRLVEEIDSQESN